MPENKDLVFTLSAPTKLSYSGWFHVEHRQVGHNLGDTKKSWDVKQSKTPLSNDSENSKADARK